MIPGARLGPGIPPTCPERRARARALKQMGTRWLQQQQQNGGQRGPGCWGGRSAGAIGRRWEAGLGAGLVPPALAGLVLVLVIVVILRAPVRAAAAAGAVAARLGAEAEAGHVLLHCLADGPLQPVADAVVERPGLGHGQHVLDHGPALLGAAQPVEELPAGHHVAAQRRAAAAVPVAAPPGLGAAHHPAASAARRAPGPAAGAGQAGLDGALGGPAGLILRAVAVLQRRAPPGVVELDQGRDAVARAPPPGGAYHHCGRRRLQEGR